MGSLNANANPTTHRDTTGFGGQWGYYTDTETGLLCLTHRYYDPGTGKFINRDPIGYDGGMNLYGFAGGNPVNESDPDGFAPADHLNGKDVARIDPDKLWMRPNHRGSAPIGEDGRGVEIHHVGQNPNGPFQEMTFTDHRGPGNKGRNHPAGPPGVDHGPEWTSSTRKYWERMWDAGRFDGLPSQPGPTPNKGWGLRAAEEALAGMGKAGKAAKLVGGKVDGLNALLFLMDAKANGLNKAVNNFFWPASIPYANGRAEGIFEVAGPGDVPRIR